MKNLSKISFLLVNTLFFVAVLLYVYSGNSNLGKPVFSYINGEIYFWLSISIFLYGILFYFIDSKKIGTDKNLRDDYNFLLFNTLGVSIFLLIASKNLELELISLAHTIIFFVLGNTAYWMVSHLAVVGLGVAKYSNELIEKIQRNLGICLMISGIIVMLIMLIFRIKEFELSPSVFNIILILLPVFSSTFTIMTIPEDERFPETE